MTTEQRTAQRPPILWWRSIAWLLFLGPFFFFSYGAANQYAANRGISNSLFFEWERYIAFVAWTILPYWSIDLLYGLSFLCYREKSRLDRHALRLLTAQIVAVACFFLFPLRFAFQRPESTGIAQLLFSALEDFDAPYNQAPSLHIALLVLIWHAFLQTSASPLVKAVIHGWSLLIAISVLTTWQHHFIDIPTGAAVGFLCLWLWPEKGRPPLWTTLTSNPRRLRLAGRYFAGASLLLMLALVKGGIFLWLCWPALSLALVAINYLWAGAQGFQKHDGRHSLAVRALMAPYLAAAWINTRLWTRKHPKASAIAENLFLGRHPSATEFAQGGYAAMLDLAAELPSPKAAAYLESLPWLDLTCPSAQQLLLSAQRIDQLRTRGNVLVACALGFSRSAAAVSAWLYWSGRCENMAAAVEHIRARRPMIVLKGEWITLFDEFESLCKHSISLKRDKQNIT